MTSPSQLLGAKLLLWGVRLSGGAIGDWCSSAGIKKGPHGADEVFLRN